MRGAFAEEIGRPCVVTSSMKKRAPPRPLHVTSSALQEALPVSGLISPFAVHVIVKPFLFS